MRNGVMTYDGTITDKTELKMSRNNDPYVAFSFSVNKRAKQGDKWVNVPMIFTGDNRLWAWRKVAYMIDAIPVGGRCLIELAHSIKKDVHVFNVSNVIPINTDILSAAWNAAEGKTTQTPQAPPQTPPPEPTPPAMNEVDDGLPF